MSATHESLKSYLPARLVRRLAAGHDGEPDLGEEALEATILFADVSGFTRLTERLAGAGPEGAETLTTILNGYLDTLLAEIARFGGEVLRFAGDAAIALFDAPPRESVPFAAQCGWEIQRAMAEREPVADEQLTLRIGISCGPLRAGIVGGAADRWEYMLAGTPVVDMGPAAAAAQPGEVVLAPEAARRLRWLGDVCEPLADGYVRLTGPITDLPPAKPAVAPEDVPPDLLRPFVQRTVLARLDAGQLDWVAELRRVTVVFVNVTGIDEEAADVMSTLQSVAAAIQGEIYRFEGSVNQLLNDDKGTTLLAAWGLPSSAFEDDAVRGVRAALAAYDTLRSMGLGASVGVTSGRAFCGLRGNELRREYAMLGAVVNLAARLMQAAGDGVLVDRATVEASSGRLDFGQGVEITVKGRTESLLVFRPLGRDRRAPRRAAQIVGRAEERERLRRALESLAGTSSAAVVIEGEAGIGKSVLLDFCAREANALGVSVLAGAADAVESATAYYVWRDVIRGLFAGFEDASLREEVLRRLDDETLASWAPLLSVVLPLDLPDNEITSQMTGLARAETVRRLVVRLLREAASRAPLLIVLDDGHWFDSSSWALALDVARRVPGALLLIATRPLPEPMPSELERILASSATLHVALAPLDADEALELVRRRLQVEELPAEVVSFVRERSQGNPFFSEQLAYALRDAGHLRIDQGRAHLDPNLEDLAEIDLPDTMKGVITGRIDALTPQQQLTLKVASAIGRVFAYTALLDVHPVEGDRPLLLGQLEDLAHRDLIQVDSPDPELAYLFKHVVLQDVVYELMSFQQRRQLHRAFALWLERRFETDLAPYLPLLAHHWRQTDDWERALHYLERAGEQSLDNDANAEAVRFLDAAVELADAHPASVSEERRWRFDSWRAIANIKLSRYDEADACFRRALATIGHALPRTKLTMTLDLVTQIARQVLHRLTGAGPRGGDVRRKKLHQASQSHQHHAECFYWHQDTLGLVHASLRSLNDAERAGVADDVARAYATIAIVCQVAGQHRLAYWYSDRSLQTLERMDSLPEIAYVTMLALVSRLPMDSEVYQDRFVERAAELFERLGDSFRFEMTLACGAFLTFSRGDYEAVRAHTDRIHASGWPDGNPQTQLWGLATRLATEVLAGGLDGDGGDRLAQLDHVLTLGGVDSASRMLGHGISSLARLVEGDEAGSRTAADETWEIMRSDPPISSVASYGLWAAAWSLLELSARGDEAARSRAAEIVAALRKLSRTARIARSPALYFEGKLRGLSGDPDRAARTLRRALALDDAFAVPYFTARACTDLSQAPSVEARERRELEARAAELFARLGVPAEPAWR